MATVQEKIAQFHEKLKTIEMGGGQKRIDKQHAQGKMTARERLNKLFDEGSFTEISQFIRHRDGIRHRKRPSRLRLCRRFYR